MALKRNTKNKPVTNPPVTPPVNPVVETAVSEGLLTQWTLHDSIGLYVAGAIVSDPADYAQYLKMWAQSGHNEDDDAWKAIDALSDDEVLRVARSIPGDDEEAEDKRIDALETAVRGDRSELTDDDVRRITAAAGDNEAFAKNVAVEIGKSTTVLTDIAAYIEADRTKRRGAVQILWDLMADIKAGMVKLDLDSLPKPGYGGPKDKEIPGSNERLDIFDYPTVTAKGKPSTKKVSTYALIWENIPGRGFGMELAKKKNHAKDALAQVASGPFAELSKDRKRDIETDASNDYKSGLKAFKDAVRVHRQKAAINNQCHKTVRCVLRTEQVAIDPSNPDKGIAEILNRGYSPIQIQKLEEKTAVAKDAEGKDATVKYMEIVDFTEYGVSEFLALNIPRAVLKGGLYKAVIESSQQEAANNTQKTTPLNKAPLADVVYRMVTLIKGNNMADHEKGIAALTKMMADDPKNIELFGDLAGDIDLVMAPFWDVYNSQKAERVRAAIEASKNKPPKAA